MVQKEQKKWVPITQSKLTNNIVDLLISHSLEIQLGILAEMLNWFNFDQYNFVFDFSDFYSKLILVNKGKIFIQKSWNWQLTIKTTKSLPEKNNPTPVKDYQTDIDCVVD